VEASPGPWVATLPLHELMDLLEHPLDNIRLDGIAHWWRDDELVLALGPVHLRGAYPEWRALARRLLSSALSAEQLRETPWAGPWAGPTMELSPRQVVVPVRKRRRNRRPAQVVDRQVAALALAGGFDAAEFVDLFGTGWTRTREAFDSFIEYAFDGENYLYVWGEPPQLAAATGPEGLMLGTPSGYWELPGTFVAEMIDPVPVHGSMPREEIRAVVHGLLGRRRRSFTWCRYCGCQLAPEKRASRDVCYGCQTSIEGGVY
jgi:hypothetical protein